MNEVRGQRSWKSDARCVLHWLVIGRRIDILLLYPLVVPALLVSAGNDGFGFDSPGWLDSFVYLGYFWHYQDHLWLFDDNSNYKISRLPWILPGALAHALLAPVAAAHVLAYLTLASAAVSLYLFTRDALQDRHVAAFISVLIACCTWMHGAGGWNYHALAAAGFYLWSCWMLTRAAVGSHPLRWSVAAGVLYAAAVHTNLFLLAFAPLLGLLYWAAREQRARPLTVADWAGVAACTVAGALFLTLLLAAINRTTGGQWLFFIPQIEQARKVAGDKYWSPASQWLPNATYLVLPIVMAVAGLLTWHRPWQGQQRLAKTFALLPCLALGIMSLSQFVMRQTTLDYPYMAIPLYFHAFGGAALLLSAQDETIRARQMQLALAAALLLVPLLLFLPTEPKALMGALLNWLGLANVPGIVPPLALGLFGVLASKVSPQPLRLMVFATSFAFVNAWIAPQPSAYGLHTAGVRQEMLETFRDADRFAQSIDPNLIGIKYWISNEDLKTQQGVMRSQEVFDSYLATRAWLANLFARTSPGLSIDRLTVTHLAAAACVGILSSTQRQEELSEAMMAHYASLGRPLIVIARRQFERAKFGFALTVLKPATTTALNADIEPPCFMTR